MFIKSFISLVMMIFFIGDSVASHHRHRQHQHRSIPRRHHHRSHWEWIVPAIITEEFIRSKAYPKCRNFFRCLERGNSREYCVLRHKWCARKYGYLPY